MNRIKKILVKLKLLLLMSWYTLFFYKPGLKESWIFLESKNGKDLGSNLLRIAEELTHNPDYSHYRIFLSCYKDKKEDIRKMTEQYRLKGIELIREGGFRHAQIAASAKYLITDTSFPLWFTKKEGQIITNTWHGTPLKMMGRDVGNRSFDMGNVLKSHLISDYLLYPSDYMRDIMVSAYFLDNLYQGKILHSGYPRNSVFFHKERGPKLRKDLGLEGKRLYGYMPTWRGVLKKLDNEKVTNQFEYYFAQMDEQFQEDEIFFVRLHPFVGNTIDYSLYEHIKPFPEGYDPYDVLNMCDCLVTDYSSVFFDFANSRKKIILFIFDKELYIDERGIYVSLDELPFPKVRRVEELLGEMRSPKQYEDGAFLERFCQYDDRNVAEKVCRHVIKGEKVYEEFQTAQNGRENVLIYAGSLVRNGLTTALLNLLANIGVEKRNYYLSFRSSNLAKNPERVSQIPENLGFIPIANMKFKSLGEAVATYLYFKKDCTSSLVVKKVDRFYSRVYQRSFGGCNFKAVIHYAGYDKDIINLFLHAPARRMIYVHNDMVKEIKTRHNQHVPTIRRAYREYDKVVPIVEYLCRPALELGEKKEIIQVARNCHDYRSVLEKSKKEISFEMETECSVSLDELKDILNSDAKKMITIGRFSPEKGHDLLLQAFDKYYGENPNSYLIIIGGHGDLYGQTVALANSLSCAAHVVIIKTIQNPMPILKKCDLFVISSHYEGLCMVLWEADTLKVPVISTDIEGPRGFMEEHGGYLVSLDAEGIYEGMKAFDAGKVKALNVDYEKHNQNAVKQFEELFEGDH